MFKHYNNEDNQKKGGKCGKNMDQSRKKIKKEYIHTHNYT
jgi:hypothetical protein